VHRRVHNGPRKRSGMSPEQPLTESESDGCRDQSS
jgi:hypothetical protein